MSDVFSEAGIITVVSLNFGPLLFVIYILKTPLSYYQKVALIFMLMIIRVFSNKAKASTNLKMFQIKNS